MRRSRRAEIRGQRRRAASRRRPRSGVKDRSRSLGFEPLEVRLPLAVGVATDVTTESMQWQGQNVEVQRGGWIVQIDPAQIAPAQIEPAQIEPDDQSYPRILQLGPQVQGTDARLHAAASQVGRRISSAGQYVFQFRRDVPPELAMEVFARTPGIEYAEPDFVVSTDGVPDDPEFPSLWGLDNGNDFDIDAPEAWDLTTGSSSVVVGVIDSGVDYTHEDLAANMWTNPVECPAGPGTCLEDGIDDDGNGFVDDFYGWDFVNGDNDPFDDHSHGTHVAGTVAAAGNNATGVTGVNWNAQIMALKFIGSSGSGPVSAAIAAIEYATMMKRDHGVNIPITNNSWGSNSFSQALKDAINASGQEGMLFVAAAGNDASNTDATPHYPSSYDLGNVVSVASTTSSGGLSSFSNWGLKSVDLGAPGSSVLSTEPLGQYDYKSGTSMASPHVAGVAALAWGAAPDASVSEIKNAILSTVDPFPALQGKSVTGGHLNARATLESLGLFVGSTSPSEGDLVRRNRSISHSIFRSLPDPSVQASDLQVNSVPADSFDTRRWRFDHVPLQHVAGVHRRNANDRGGGR